MSEVHGEKLVMQVTRLCTMADFYCPDSQVTSLQDYICSLDLSTLPRILEIHSGVYFQGSVYEISGNECCLSTGELIKIIHVELQKVVCENMDNECVFDLSLNYSGNFKLIPDGFPFTSVEEIIKSLGIENQNSEAISFQSLTDIITDHAVIGKGEPITVVSTEYHEGQMYADCIVDGDFEQVHVALPFTLKGEFYECQDDNLYTVKDIIESKVLTKRRVRLDETKGICMPKHFNGALVLSPVYEIQAIMHYRKEAVKIPSTLEVDVRDITKEQKDMTFIQPLSLSDIVNQPHEKFPMLVKILDAPEQQPPFKSEWFHSLRKGRVLKIHKKQLLKKVLATSMLNKVSRHFLICTTYKGTFKRRPREFATVFDLCNAISPEDPLNVVVTKDCMWNEDGLSSLCVGDRIVTMFRTTMQMTIDGVLQNTDVLMCSKSPESEDEDEEEDDYVMLPLYLEGRFVEEVHDTKRYKILEICDKFKLPFQVKTTSRDPSLPNDILTSFPAIKLEEIIEVPNLVVSFLEGPSECFSIPVDWMTMSVCHLEGCPTEDHSLKNAASVEELTDFMYYDLRKLSTATLCPPPRPPKRQSISILSPDPTPVGPLCRSPFPDSEKQQPPLPPKGIPVPLKPNIIAENEAIPPSLRKPFSIQPVQAAPNEYTKAQKGETKMAPEAPEKESGDDSDHDYEQIEEGFALMALQKVKRWAF
ncbi:protein THEMIS isoform X2 [Carcharodon carcharias]|uniref:protein THEMIS isoform X2 n=1 Tax=Carcharodon carcharias TaxID=13397 RepID=UPI001B7F096A|nr:protein THEMIS isoform X2 [Carcharodon carcharias]